MKNFKYLLVAMLAAGALTACSTNGKAPDSVTNETQENVELDLKEEGEELDGEVAISPEVVSGRLGDAVVAVRDALGEGYLPNAPIYIDQLEEVYGVNPTDVKQFIGEVPMIGMYPDVFIAIEANEGAVEAVKTALTNYKEYLINDSLQYPMNLAKVETTQVVTYGNYVFLVLLGTPNDNMDASDEEAKEFAQAEAQKAMDALESVLGK